MCHAALSGTDCCHCESFSLASLRSRIAFFSESDSAPRAFSFSSSQGPVRKKQWGRGFERPETSAPTLAQCPRASSSPQGEHSLAFVLLPPLPSPPLTALKRTLWMSPWPRISACPRLSDGRRQRAIYPSCAEPLLHSLDDDTICPVSHSMLSLQSLCYRRYSGESGRNVTSFF